MDWTGLQLIVTFLMIACYLYADRRRLRAWVRNARQYTIGRVAVVQARIVAPASDPAPLVAAGKVLPVAWLTLLNEQPDRYPHTLIIGPTGSGKTTFTRALLASRAGRVAVLTPKPDASDWPGVPIVTIDDDGAFSDLTRAFLALEAEVKQRLVAAKRQQSPGLPLTIVCDDWPVLASECGRPASDLFKLVGRLGRSLRVRLVVLSQSERVKSLGLDGEGDAVSNFARVLLSRGHGAQLLVDGYTLALDTQQVPRLANHPTQPGRWWEPVPVVPEAPIGADLPILPEPVPVVPDLVPAGSHAAEPVPEAEKIRILSQQGYSRNQIANEIGGRKADALERIRAVLG